MEFVIKRGATFYRRRYSTYGGNWTGSLSDATRWKTRVGAERALESVRDYKRRAHSYPERALAEIVVSEVV